MIGEERGSIQENLLARPSAGGWGRTEAQRKWRLNLPTGWIPGRDVPKLCNSGSRSVSSPKPTHWCAKDCRQACSSWLFMRVDQERWGPFLVRIQANQL
jgi:hypothetical protein